MKSDIENKEWLEEFEALKKVNPANPFTVPSGYFEDLDQRIISSIRIEAYREAGDFNGLTVPEDYFEKLAGNIQSRISVEDAVSRASGDFTVPEGYFEDLANNIQSRIIVEQAMADAGNNLAVPEGYFEQLADNIQSRIAVEEFLGETEPGFAVPSNYFEDMEQQIQSRISVDTSLGAHENGFTVPEGYFENLSSNIFAKTSSYETDKRRGVVRKLFASAAFKYASAACLALFIGAGIFIAQIESPEARHNRSYLHKALFKVPDNEIENYLQIHMDASDTKALLDHAETGNIKNSTDLQYDLSIN